MLYRKHLFFFCSLFLLSYLHADELRHIVILQTSDIHSHIYGANAGWLRIASLIESEKRNAGGGENILLVDCGDTLAGSMIAYLSRGMAGAVMLNALEYDAWILGNHDFELGNKRLYELCRYIRADTLAGNLKWQYGALKAWKIYRKNGAKIALIGLTSPHLSEWLWGPEMRELKTSQLIDALDKIMPEVSRAEPDMIILATHHGRFSPARLRNGVYMSKVALRYPQIDLILGGHTHQDVPGEKSGTCSWYVLCGAHGENLAKIDVWIDIEKGRTKEIKSKLLPVTYATPRNKRIAALMKIWHRKTIDFSETAIGQTKLKIKTSSTSFFKNGMRELFGRAIAEITNASVAVISPPVRNAVFSNTIYEKDLFKAEPYDDTVCVLFLTKQELQSIMSEQFNRIGKGKFQSLYGLSVIRGKSVNISPVLPDGKDWGAKRIPVAFTSYSLAGAGGRFPVLKKIAMNPECKGENTGILVRDALRNYIKKHYPVSKP